MIVFALKGLNPRLLCGPGLLNGKPVRGQTIPLVATIAFAIVILGVGIFFLIQLLGGSREFQNAVDSGTLQVSKKALFAPRVQLSHSNPTTGVDEITEFGGVSLKVKQLELSNFPTIVPPDDGNYYVDLLGINGIWGQALLEALNVQRMQMAGVATTQAIRNAQRIQRTAADISSRLSQNLLSDSDPTQSDPGVSNPLDTTFRRLANDNTVRMLEQTGLVRKDDYSNSFTYRGKDSNIELNVDQQTVGLLNLNGVTSGQPYLGTSNSSGVYLKGYVPATVPLGAVSLDFMFVPLEVQKKPHLISQIQFNQDANATTIGSPLTASVPPSIPPDAFHFSALVNVEKASKDMEHRAFAASKDMTGGLKISSPRGFIRIENPGGANGTPFHVLELANQETVNGYNAMQGLLGGEAGPVLGNSLFNPVQNNYGNNSYAQDGAALMAVACSTMSLLGWNNVAFITCIPCLFAIPPCFNVCYPAMCFAQIVCAFTQGCGDVPDYDAGSFWNIANPGFHPVYAYMPGESMPGTGRGHNSIDTRGICNVTPENAGLREHKIFWDWLEGKSYIDFNALVISFMTAPCSLCWWSQNLHGGGISQYPKFNNFDADSAESGMKDRMPAGGHTFSLLNRRTLTNFTTTGTLSSLLYGRLSTDPTPPGAVTTVYNLMYQRIREIAPESPAAEIQSVLSSTKPIPMGANAFIYLDDSQHLQLSVPANGDVLPPWLTPVQNAPPDGDDFHKINPTQFEYRDPDQKNRCYRLVNPNQDFITGTEIYAPTSDNYPTRVCSYDIYHFSPSSGFNGLMGVLKLGSKVERKCMVHGVIDTSKTPWTQPDDCFCYPHPDGSKDQTICKPSVF